ncbi:MAG: hypothetical protein QM713_09620 [Arachnia sp.]
MKANEDKTSQEDLRMGTPTGDNAPQTSTETPGVERLTSTELSEPARLMAEAFAKRSRRVSIPVRNSFVRASGSTKTPLAHMAATRGHGGETKLKLYFALLWLSVSPPYDTTLPAANWATLLDLDDPTTKGARCVRKALSELESLGLVSRQLVPGAAARVQLLREDGSGDRYTPPSASHRRGAKKITETDRDRYFKIPTLLWTSGHLQRMSSAALTMLLVILEESRGREAPQWWTQEDFNTRFGVSKDVRAKGTRELVARRLIEVDRQPVAATPTQNVFFSSRRVRNTYCITNEAAGHHPRDGILTPLGKIKTPAT